MKTKKIIIITLLISIILYFFTPISLAESLADVEGPNINAKSFKINKTKATIGDTVTISLEITDNIEMNYAYIYYELPITQKNKSIQLTKNNSTGRYEAKIKIDKNCEAGIWKITYISATDKAFNQTKVYNSKGKYKNQAPKEDLSKGNITVTGTNPDLEAPNINVKSLKIDKTKVTIGDTVTVSLEITDNSGIEYAFIHYTTPITQKSESYRLIKNKSTGKYEAKIKIDENYEKGVWKIYNISANDSLSNFKIIYNSKGKTALARLKEDWK